MIPFRRAVVAVGDTDSSAGLLRYARILPLLSPEMECHFIHVMGWPDRQAAGPPVTHEMTRRQLEDAVGANFGDSGTISCRVLHGNLVDRILESAVELSSDLILLGHRAAHSGRRSLSRRLAMKAPCSVWMRPDGSCTSAERVLAAIDYSTPSAWAMTVAAQIAQRSGQPSCQALHVYFDGAVVSAADSGASSRRQEREAMDRFIAPLDTGGIRIEPLFEESPSVAHAVERIAEASDVDLIVMGSRGQTPSASILLGSESEQVLMESRIPVLIAKRRGERMGLLQALLDRDFRLHDAPRFG